MFEVTPAMALRAALGPAMLWRSTLVALVVGTLLNGINQGDAILAGEPVDWLKVLLTYCVPFLVATYSARRLAGVHD